MFCTVVSLIQDLFSRFWVIIALEDSLCKNVWENSTDPIFMYETLQAKFAY